MDAEQKKSPPELAKALSELSELAEQLLERAVQHTDIYRRSIFEVPREQLRELDQLLRASSLGQFLPPIGSELDHAPDDTAIRAVPEEPAGIVFCVEEYDHTGRGDEKWINLSIDVQYTHPPDLTSAVRISLTPRWESIGKSLYFPDYAETGYEGHSGESTELTPTMAEEFTTVLEQFRGGQFEEATFSEQLRAMRLINESTGEVFYYDTERGEYVSEAGQTISEDPDSDEDLGGMGPIRVGNRYRMVPRDPSEEQ